MTALVWIDWLVLGALVVSVLVGVWRGLVFEVLSLVGWVAALVAAQLWSHEVAKFVPIGVPGDAVNHGASMAITFVGALIVWGLASRLIRMAIRATPLSGVDRLLGAGFGALRAVVLLLLTATVVLMTPAARSPEWQRSLVGPVASSWVVALKPLLPEAVTKHLPSVVTRPVVFEAVQGRESATV